MEETFKFFREAFPTISASVALATAASFIVLKYLVRKAEARSQRREDAQRERLSRLEGRVDAVAASGSAAGIAAQETAVARRMDAIGSLWKSYIRLRDAMPPLMNSLDFFVHDPSSMNATLLTPAFAEALDNLPSDFLMTTVAPIANSADEFRPFVGESLWSLFFAYRAIMAGVVFSLLEHKRDGSTPPWFEDEGVARLLTKITTDNEFREFRGLHFGRLTWIRTHVERRYMTEVDKIMSGETASQDAVRVSTTIFQAAQDLLAKSQERKS